MTFTVPQLVILAVIILIVGFLIHKYLPASKVAQAEGWLAAEAGRAEPALKSVAAKIETTAESWGMQALTDAELWLTDWSAEEQQIAKATASKATKAAALRQHIAALQAKLPVA